MWRVYYVTLRLMSPPMRYVFRVLNKITQQQRSKVMLLDAEGKILLVQNALGDRKWTLPGGGIEKGESAVEAALREVREELGIVLDAGQCRQIGVVHVVAGGYDAPIVYCRLLPSQKTQIRPRRVEICATEWYNMSQLPPKTQPLVSEAYALLSPDTSIATIV